jgi:hypothetical protein
MKMTKVDLRGARWPKARAALTASMAAHRFVVVAHGALGPELPTALFARALPELYALPVEAKRQNEVTTTVPYQGHISDGAALERRSGRRRGAPRPGGRRSMRAVKTVTRSGAGRARSLERSGRRSGKRRAWTRR